MQSGGNFKWDNKRRIGSEVEEKRNTRERNIFHASVAKSSLKPRVIFSLFRNQIERRSSRALETRGGRNATRDGINNRRGKLWTVAEKIRKLIGYRNSMPVRNSRVELEHGSSTFQVSIFTNCSPDSLGGVFSRPAVVARQSLRIPFFLFYIRFGEKFQLQMRGEFLARNFTWTLYRSFSAYSGRKLFSYDYLLYILFFF